MLGFGLNLGDGTLLVLILLLLPLAKPFRFILLGVLLDERGKLAGLIRCWDRSEGVWVILSAD